MNKQTGEKLSILIAGILIGYLIAECLWGDLLFTESQVHEFVDRSYKAGMKHGETHTKSNGAPAGGQGQEETQAEGHGSGGQETQ